MARQKGVIKLEGKISDFSFYKTKDGYLAREKGGVDGNRIATDPAFQRTRENGEEFGRAGKGAKLLRNALRSPIQKSKDPRMVGRLNRAMVKVVKADQTSVRGQRNVLDGDLTLLQGFEFNVNGSLGATVFLPIAATVDRVAGTLEVVVPEFVPDNSIARPEGATHFKFISAGAEVDFENETFIVDVNDGGEIAFGPQNEAEVTLANAVTADSILPLFLV